MPSKRQHRTSVIVVWSNHYGEIFDIHPGQGPRLKIMPSMKKRLASRHCQVRSYLNFSPWKLRRKNEVNLCHRPHLHRTLLQTTDSNVDMATQVTQKNRMHRTSSEASSSSHPSWVQYSPEKSVLNSTRACCIFKHKSVWKKYVQSTKWSFSNKTTFLIIPTSTPL